jgi:hypothetical protein
VFVAVGRVGCVLSSQVAAFVSLANATGRWNYYCGRIADASVDETFRRESGRWRYEARPQIAKGAPPTRPNAYVP